MWESFHVRPVQVASVDQKPWVRARIAKGAEPPLRN